MTLAVKVALNPNTTNQTNNKILNWSKLKAVADMTKKKFLIFMIFVFDRIENIMGMGENASYKHFLLFSQCFHKAF